MVRGRWVVVALLLGAVLPAQADWWIVYSPIIVKYTGQSTYCCFPTKAACEAARAQKLQPADSIGCSGFDSPSAKKPGQQKGSSQADQQAQKAAAVKKAQAEQQRKAQEAQFRQEQAATLNALKGFDGGAGGGAMALKPVPAAGSTALQQLRCGSAWSKSAAQAGAPEQARGDAERGAQGAGGIDCPPGSGAIPEPPAPTRVSAQEQFLTTLHTRQQANQQQSRKVEQQIGALEDRVKRNDAEVAQQEQALAALNLKDAPAGESEAQRKAREALERAKAERAKLQQELERRRRERAQLAQDEQRLRQLESQYQADPQRAGQLMGEFQR